MTDDLFERKLVVIEVRVKFGLVAKGVCMPPKKKELPGALSKPKQSRVNGLAPKQAMEESIRQSVDEDISNLLKLMEHYGIDKSDSLCWEKLSLSLSRDFIPSFQEPNPPGAPTKWGYVETNELIEAVEELVEPENQSKGVVWAVEQLSKQEPWNSLTGTASNAPEILRQIYYKNRKSYHQSREDIRRTFSEYIDSVKKPS